MSRLLYKGPGEELYRQSTDLARLKLVGEGNFLSLPVVSVFFGLLLAYVQVRSSIVDLPAKYCNCGVGSALPS